MEPILGKGMGFFIFALRSYALRWIRYAPCSLLMLLWGHETRLPAGRQGHVTRN